MNFDELIKNRRSVRDYKQTDISTNVIENLLKDACMAPSACNKQPWRFIVVKDTNLIRKLSDNSKQNILSEINSDPNSNLKRFKDYLENEKTNVFYNAPCIIFIVGERNHRWLIEDCSLCASYLMLSATNNGLGSCWIALGARISDKKLLMEISLKEDYKIVAPIIIGYPNFINKDFKREKPIIL